MIEVIKKLNESTSVAILTHISEDGDCMGSAFAMAAALRKTGKSATIYVSAKVEERLGFLGDGYIIYSPEKLGEHDLCLCVDCGDIKRLGDRAEIMKKINNSVSIDHHYTNTMYADVNYVEGNASSTGEIIYKLLIAMNVEIDKEIALYLYTAISSDTGSFKFSSTSPDTMHTAAALLGYGIDHAEIARLLFDTYKLEEVKFRAALMSQVESYEDGRISVLAFEADMAEKFNIRPEDIPEVVDIPRSIAKTEIAVVLKRTNGEVRVNLRSNGDADVSKIASEFGGGGHIKAAGFRVKDAELDTVKEKVIEFAKKAIN